MATHITTCYNTKQMFVAHTFERIHRNIVCAYVNSNLTPFIIIIIIPMDRGELHRAHNLQGKRR